MRQLRLVGLGDDGTHLVLETPTGEQFRLPLDERLRAACRGDLTRLGQIEIELDAALRPREIQARVRSGESPEKLAAASGMSIERVQRFAYPVLQERRRVVAEARATRVRRDGSTPAETLAELVNERLVDRGTDPATLSWDAWRREDGGWMVRLSWQGSRAHSATWTYDLVGRMLHPEDPAAEQLIAQEFNLRTITPVTLLAAAARDAAEPDHRAPDGHELSANVAGMPVQPVPASEPGPGPVPSGAASAAEADLRSGADPVPDGAAGDRPTAGPPPARPDAGGRPATTGRTGQRRQAPEGGATRASRAAGGRRVSEAGTEPGTPATPDISSAVEPDSANRPEARVEPGQRSPEDGTGAGPVRHAHVPPWDDILLGVRRRR